MQFIINFLMGHCIIFCCQTVPVYSSPMIGPNVRRVIENEFPYVVSILRINSNPEPIDDHICTGTLISKEHVLTSEHCLYNEYVYTLQINVGSIDLRHGIKYNVFSWITYNEWAEYNDILLEFEVNDIAIIKLTEKVSNHIRPVVLLPMLNQNLYGLDVTMVGWGQSNTGEIPLILEKGSVKVVPNNECIDRIATLGVQEFPVPKMVLCTDARPHVLLHRGDSGGPLLYMDKIVGVNVGRVPLTGHHMEKLNLHFSIYYYKNYILDVINNY